MAQTIQTDACRDTVRTHDPERHLAAVLAPRDARPSLFALYAFHCELDRIPKLVSEPMLGEIRLQWWRDALQSGSSGEETGNPIADALITTISDHNLNLAHLIGMIDARTAELSGGGFPDIQALKAYLNKRDGAVFELSGFVCGASAMPLGKVAGSAGIAYGLASILRYLARDLASGCVMVPRDLFAHAGINEEALLQGEGQDGLHEAIAELADEARGALASVRQDFGQLSASCRAAFSPVALVEPTIRAVQHPSHNALHQVAEINPLKRFFRQWRAARFSMS